MASFGKVYLFAWLLWGSLGVQVTGNDSEIRRVCDKTDYFYYCYDCLSGKKGFNSNGADFGGKSILCTINAFVIVRRTTLEFSLNSTGHFQETTKVCLEKFDSCMGYCRAALKAWRLKRKSDAIQFLNFGFEMYFDCDKLITDPISQEYVKQLTKAKNLIEVSLRIISLS